MEMMIRSYICVSDNSENNIQIPDDFCIIVVVFAELCVIHCIIVLILRSNLY